VLIAPHRRLVWFVALFGTAEAVPFHESWPVRAPPSRAVARIRRLSTRECLDAPGLYQCGRDLSTAQDRSRATDPASLKMTEGGGSRFLIAALVGMAT